MWFLAAFLLLSASVCLGQPQPANAQATVTVEGAWVITQEGPNLVESNVGERVTIRRQSEGVYEAVWTSPRRGTVLDPTPQIYYGSPAEISRVETPSFAMLKESSPGIPDDALRGAITWGVQRTYYYKPMKDGRTMQFLQDGIIIVYNPQSGKFISLKKSPPFMTAILTRVPEPAAAPSRTAAPPKPATRVNTASGPSRPEASPQQGQKQPAH